MESASPSQVLLVDDDQRLCSMVSDYLQHNGMSVLLAGSGAQALTELDRSAPQLLILDLMLPDTDGLALCRSIRARNDDRASVPILMLTAKGDAMDRVIGLEMGADDYLPKPFEPRELLARARALMRRPALAVRATDDGMLSFGRLVIDLHAREVRVSGQRRMLTSHQFDLLVLLAQRPGRVLSRDQIMQLMRGSSLEAFDRSIDVHIARIRSMIEDDPRDPRRIQTVRGAGYVFAKSQH
ncbi:response regulator [Piscinibacterium candidicorallinum]|jgi:DNA-binding response OmpR family regulator|uniref:Response regulator n=1 Tax=Piscinibacterium candidicorallinum TaxID=1793872 RepID=A0ABV7H5W7_9BURK